MNIATKILSVVALSAAFTSCLKDKGYDDREYGLKEFDMGKVIELPGNENHYKSFALDFKNLDTTFNFVAVRLAAPEVADEDINVTLSLAGSTTLISEYNTENSTSLVTFPNALYSFPNGLVVTIPKGSREGYLRIRTNTINFDPSAAYALGFTIASVDKPGYIISGNFKTMIVSIQAKNKYDGAYDLSGVHNRPTLDAPYHEEPVHLITTGANSVKMYWPAAGLDAHPIHGASTYYSTFTTEFYFEATPSLPGGMYKLLKVDNPYTPGSPVFAVGPAVDSRYDPATKTIYAEFYYNNRPADRRFTDTLVYTGVR